MDAALPGLLVMAVVLGAVSVALAGLITSDRLPRNAMVGIRTPATLRSDDAWHAGHRAAAGALKTSGAAALGVTAVGTIVRLAGLVVVGGGLVLLGAVIAGVGLAVATRRAVRAARAAH